MQQMDYMCISILNLLCPASCSDWCVCFDSLLEGGGTCMYVFFFQIFSSFMCDDLPLWVSG